MISDIIAMHPLWKKYHTQLMHAEFKKKSKRTPFTPMQLNYIAHYQKALGFFHEDDDRAVEDVHLVIAESDNATRNKLSCSISSILEALHFNAADIMERDDYGIYITDNVASHTLQRLIIMMLSIEIALIQWIDDWDKFEDISVKETATAICLVLPNEKSRQPFCKAIESIFGFHLESSDEDILLEPVQSKVLEFYLDDMLTEYRRYKSMDPSLFKTQQKASIAQLEKTREKFQQNIRQSAFQPSPQRT